MRGDPGHGSSSAASRALKDGNVNGTYNDICDYNMKQLICDLRASRESHSVGFSVEQIFGSTYLRSPLSTVPQPLLLGGTKQWVPGQACRHSASSAAGSLQPIHKLVVANRGEIACRV